MAKKLWGGRFSKSMDAGFESFSRSIHYDKALAEFDVIHSILHVKALHNAGLINDTESRELRHALTALMQDIKEEKFSPDPGEEDIHSAVQNTLQKEVGDLALKLHTLRSRNDQIAFDVKLYSYRKALHMQRKIDELTAAYAELAEKYPHAPFIGYTHTQRAQVIRFPDHCYAYAEMFGRDGERLADYLKHVKIKIGAGALSGTSIPRSAYTDAIGEYDPENKLKISAADNSLDHVADRDFVIELLSICSIIQMHLSRFAEDMILYSTAEYDYIDLPEEFCTGSSLMPHKKNADLMELVRGATGNVYGDLLSLLVSMKGLPLAYNRDMQLDKEPLFRTADLVLSEIDQLSRFVPGITLKEDKIAEALEDEHLYGVEIAEYLVHQGAPFRKAHTIVGKLIRYSEDHKIPLREIPDRKLTEFHESLSGSILKKIMTPEYAIRSKARDR
ncbi:MAG: argininosuccinate lyase [Fidelibacterota bacterium]